MDIPSFTRATNDAYVRHYEVSPEIVGGLSVTIYAECSLNLEKVNNHYYFLNIFFSVDDYDDREFLIGVSFGTEEMDEASMAKEMDIWVDQIVSDDESFPACVQDYLRKEQVWEDAFATTMEAEAIEGTDEASEIEKTTDFD